MAAYSFKRVQNIPVTLETAWDFFSNPANLAQITPGDMRFKIISRHHGENIFAGQLIEYKIKPFLGIPFYWMTEITHVKEKEYFIDVQRHGPYKLWHHQHFFKAVQGGVEMTDIVHYKTPMWWLGALANRLFLRKKLMDIFDHRATAISKILGKAGAVSV